ncbi:MAG: vWA domain-containing protein [Planctomycetota bacterium]
MLPLIAILLPVMLILIAFAINVAYMQMVRTELRAATDAAAQAATHTLMDTGDVDLARQKAIEIAGKNVVAGKQLVLRAEDISLGQSEPQADGSYTFIDGAAPFNCVRVNGARTASSADGSVPLPFQGFLETRMFEPETFAVSTFQTADICLVLDRSSSMKLKLNNTSNSIDYCNPPTGNTRWTALVDGVDVFCDTIEDTLATERVAVVTYGGGFNIGEDLYYCDTWSTDAQLDTNFTKEMNTIRTVMSGYSSTVWNGNTHIDAGIQIARQTLENNAREGAEKIMIVLTDGNHNGGPLDPQVLAAVDAGIRIYTITFSSGANQLAMQNVATLGGGEHFHANSANELEEVFRKLGAMPVTLIQ